MELFEAMQRRRSVRKYTDEKISQEIISKILQAGLSAPSSRGLAPCELILVRDKDMLQKLAEIKTHGAAPLKQADAAIVVLGDCKKADTWIEDTSIVMTYMHVAAASLGIGSCWIQCRLRGNEVASAEENARKLLDFPENMRLEAILTLGIPAEEIQRNDSSSLRFDKIHYEKY